MGFIVVAIATTTSSKQAISFTLFMDEKEVMFNDLATLIIHDLLKRNKKKPISMGF